MLRSIVFLLLLLPSVVAAQHTRIYAVVAGNDDPANSMAGSSLGSGLWQSDDTGRTWKQLGWKHIKAFSMDVDSNGRVLYLAAGNGVLKSTDYGESWNVMTDWRVSEVMDVKLIPKKPNIVLAATAHGVVKSTDHGVTWRTIHDGIPQPYTSRIILSSKSIYVCNENGAYETYDLERWSKVENVAGAVRSFAEYPSHFLALGDTSFSILSYYGQRIGPFPHPYPLWAGTSVPATQQSYVGGSNGIGLLENGEGPEHPYVITYEGPKNVHALTAVGDVLLAGTLGDGIWAKHGAKGQWERLGLPKAQVWTLKTLTVW